MKIRMFAQVRTSLSYTFRCSETIRSFRDAGRAIVHMVETEEEAHYEVLTSFISGEAFSDGLPGD